MREHPEFEPAPLGEAAKQFGGECRLTVLPSYFDSDGFFIAKFVRR